MKVATTITSSAKKERLVYALSYCLPPVCEKSFDELETGA